MPESRWGTLSAAACFAAFARLGVSHLLGVPDNGSARLFDPPAPVADERRPRVLRVTREGEAFAIAAGLWMGGARPVVVIQNTGLLESGDSLRGTAVRMGVPLLVLVGYRGFGKMQRAPAAVRASPAVPESLRRSDVDSVALLTEPTLDAWGIPHRTLEPGHEDVGIGEAWEQAYREERPVALLLTHGVA